MTSVLHFAISEATKEVRVKVEKKDDFSAEVDHFEEALIKLDIVLSHSVLDIALSKKLLQGPLSDVLTHKGQLAMLSIIFATPIEVEDFFSADLG